MFELNLLSEHVLISTSALEEFIYSDVWITHNMLHLIT